MKKRFLYADLKTGEIVQFIKPVSKTKARKYFKNRFRRVIKSKEIFDSMESLKASRKGE